jgi:hypothetical protein
MFKIFKAVANGMSVGVGLGSVVRSHPDILLHNHDGADDLPVDVGDNQAHLAGRPGE